MRGFQLWINLPAKEKMKPAAYRDIQPGEIPAVDLADGGRARVIAGEPTLNGRKISGPIHGSSTDPLYLDVELPAGARFAQAIPAGYNAFVYPFEGSVQVGEDRAPRALKTHDAGVLGDGDEVVLTAGPQGARLILLAGRPLREPIAQYGPFVMNTREEIEQAIRDYQNGVLTA
jgi:redox-sensitive bicupin YhaK (pirin superfamily)